jgi:two-component system chemotaxis response regulator CheB
MELGAVDYIPKQLSKVSLDIIKIEDELRDKVKTVAKRNVRPSRTKPHQAARPAKKDLEEHKHKAQKRDVVGIGVSTGGPPAVQRILSEMEPGFPGSIFIAQHMPGAFTAAFAKRLNDCSPLEVKLAEHGERVRKGCVYVAPGGSHLEIKQRGSHLDIAIASEPVQTLYKPSVNILIESLAQAVGKRGLGVILTGMGNDGLEGVRSLKAKQGRALAQSDASCVVYGMPRSIVEEGLADEVVELEEMSRSIVRNLFL